MTSLELRKLIVKLRNKDKLSIGVISKTVGKSKSIIHSIGKPRDTLCERERKLEETGSFETKKPPGRHWKITTREDKWIGNVSKSIRFATATVISKRANANFGIKISRHTISRKLKEINLNSRVASTKSYISKKNKMSRLKFTTEHIIWTEEQWDCIHFSDVSKFNLFGSDICLSALKAALNLEEEVWWCLTWFMFCTGSIISLPGKINATVYKEILKKYVIPNLRTAVNQPVVFMQDNPSCHTAKSV